MYRPRMYAELVCRSNFSFLRGASHPDELVVRAAELGLTALAVTDRDGLYGVVKAHLAAQAVGLPLLVGAELTLIGAPRVIALVQDNTGYRNLCALISESRLTHPKGQAGLRWERLAEQNAGLSLVLPDPDASPALAPLAEAFKERFLVGISRTFCAKTAAREARARMLAQTLGVPLLAHNDVYSHVRERQALQDVLTAIRQGTTLSQAGRRLLPNGERTLKGPQEMQSLFADLPDALAQSVALANRCHFSIKSLRYHFPQEELPRGHTPASYLRECVEKGLVFRFPQGVSPKVRKQIHHELALIEQLDFPGYFLAIYDIVQFARGQGILCQGRGSAANSAVCFALQITSIDPVRMELLFERFISAERGEPPDIDVDFEHERREEVLQYIYQRHGRARASMVCEVISYRGRLALREVGKTLGLSLDQVDRLAKSADGHGPVAFDQARLREAGVSSEDRAVQLTLKLARELGGFPRHLSIHVGGFVMTQEPIATLVPQENASMANRTVVQWDKDDLSEVGILKVDILALGMLTAISKAFGLIERSEGTHLTLATLPAEDSRVYDMLCEGDALGVFQLESRAQISMLPRLKPRRFYDLVIQIAIIRPGPILGDMVHPFLRRRDGLEEVTYPSPEIEDVLSRTLGVPLFQEQAMRLAIVAAGFSAGEADRLRRALTHKRADELLVPYRSRFIEGAVSRGYAREFAERCFEQFRGFSNYGFPESHSASFALIAYASAYIKRYYPAAFTAALINSQPMGFYSPNSLVEDLKRHGGKISPVDVLSSDWDCTLQSGAVRLGLRLVKGLREVSGRRLAEARMQRPFADLSDLARRSGLLRHELVRLGMAGALDALAGGRRPAIWAIQSLGPLDEDDLFFGLSQDDTQVDLPKLTAAEQVSADFETIGVALEQHPMTFFRKQLNQQGALSAAALAETPQGKSVQLAGMVICRQRPPTAKGVSFLSLEDETGIANVVVPPQLFEKYRREILSASFLYARGRLQRAGKVVNVQTHHLSMLKL